MRDNHKIIVLSGILSVSNMGQPMPEAKEIARAKAQPDLTLNSSMMFFCERYMETNAHERMFSAEARMWQKQLTKMSDEDAARAWPDIISAYDRA